MGNHRTGECLGLSVVNKVCIEAERAVISYCRLLCDAVFEI